MYIVLPFISILFMIIIIYHCVNKFGLKIRLNLLLVCGFLGMFFGLVMPKILLPQLSLTGTVLLVLFLMFILSAFLAWFFGMEETKKEALSDYIDIQADINDLSFAFTNNNVDNDNILDIDEDTMYIKNYYPEQEFIEDKTFICSDDFAIETLDNASFDVKKYDVEQQFSYNKYDKTLPLFHIETQDFLAKNPLLSSYKQNYKEQAIIEPVENTVFNLNEQQLVNKEGSIKNDIDTFDFQPYDENQIIYIDSQQNRVFEYYMNQLNILEQDTYLKENQIHFPTNIRSPLLVDNKQEYIENFGEFNNITREKLEPYTKDAIKDLEEKSNLLILRDDNLEELNLQEKINISGDNAVNYNLEDSYTNSYHKELLKTTDTNYTEIIEKSVFELEFEKSIDNFLQENNAKSIDEKLSYALYDDTLTKQEMFSYLLHHSDDEQLPYQRTIINQDFEIKESNTQFPVSDNIDDLLDFAFEQKEQGNYKEALSIFEMAYGMYANISNVAILLNIEIANTYKHLGEYDNAIFQLENAITQSDSLAIKQDFTTNIAYFNIIKTVLKTNDFKFLPYKQIPVKVKEDIEKEFLQYKKQINS